MNDEQTAKPGKKTPGARAAGARPAAVPAASDAEEAGKGRAPRPKPPRFSGRSARFGTVDFALKRHDSPHGQVTAVSMMKDEGPFVIEWVAHQLVLGFTDIVVYTNDCSDGTDAMLIRLEELGLVHHRENRIPPGQRPQPSALNHAEAEPVVQASDWLMVFDADEFLSIRHGDGTLDGLIGAAKAQGANGIVVTWRVFGSAGVVDWSRAPVSEQYLMAAPPDWNKGWGVKTLFAYDADYWKLGIHRPKMKNRHIDTDFPDRVKWLNGSGREMEDYFKFRGWRSIVRTVGYDWVQLNHYAVKSAESYALRKLRGNVNFKKDKYNADYWSLQDRNEVRDDTMLRYSDRRNAVMAALLSDPVLAGLHQHAVEAAEARLAMLRSTPEYGELLAGLAQAGEVPIGAITAKPPQARDKQKIAALMSDVEKRRGEKARAARLATPSQAEALEGPASEKSLYLPVVRPVGGDWIANRDVLLPADPGVFGDTVLALIRRGKFERRLARALPGHVPEGAKVLEFGAGCGFVGALLSRLVPGLRLVVQEADPALEAVLVDVLRRNTVSAEVTRSRDYPSGAAVAALLAAHRPQVLVVGCGRISGAALVQGLEVAGVEKVVLHGRALGPGGAADDIAHRLEACGFSAVEVPDPGALRVFRHG